MCFFKITICTKEIQKKIHRERLKRHLIFTYLLYLPHHALKWKCMYTRMLHWGLRIDKLCDKELTKFLELILCICKQFLEAC